MPKTLGIPIIGVVKFEVLIGRARGGFGEDPGDGDEEGVGCEDEPGPFPVAHKETHRS